MKDKINSSLKKMAGIISEMIELVEEGFLKNDAHYLDRALNKERIMDDLEKEITNAVFGISKDLNEEARKDYLMIEENALNIERMGDELRSLMERMEIKIAESLIFSEIAFKQYMEIFDKTKISVEMIKVYINQKSKELADKILENGLSIKELIEKYRIEHLERLAKGICEARAANMFYDMLDFTGNIARHCTNIAKNYTPLNS